MGLSLNILRKSLLIRGCSPSVNRLTVAVRIDDKAERVVLTEEYLQLNFLKYRVKNLGPLATSALSWPISPFSEQKLNNFPKYGAYCFAVPSD